MSLDKNWFTEIDAGNGCALSIHIQSKLHEEQTPFQKIEIYDTTLFGNLMVIDGFIMLSQRDNFIYHEMMAHPVLFSHPNPKNVVIIGGGDCGTLQQALKHPHITTLTQVDIDERVTRLSEQFFPELCSNNNDPRVRLIFDDGIQWIKQVEPESLDVIIVDSTDPIGPAQGLFNQDFQQNCFTSLKDGGLYIQQSESPLFHHSKILIPLRNNLKKADFSAVESIYFPQPVYPSGWWSATVGSKGRPFAFHRRHDAINKTFNTLYYNAGIHQASLAPPEFMKL